LHAGAGSNNVSEARWIGKSVKRVEDARLLTGRGTYIDDHPPVANACHAAIVRSPLPHATIRGYDLSAALALDGVVGAITGEDVARHTKPFSVGVTAPIHYYCAATDRVRFVGEPVVVVVAKNRYLAEDAADLVRVDYDPLPTVVDPERALDSTAPVLHEAVGSNLAGNRRLVYGEPERAFREADVVLSERFSFPKYASTPIETYGVIARWDPLDGVCTA
jgi:2-furoyl-CoA dehydrogenase large subunit